MGFEVALALSAFQALGQVKAAKAEAKAVAAEGELVAKNKAQEVAFKAARQRSSFLTSGLTLEGTPMAAIESTFNVGLEDIGAIRSGYNTKAKNIMSQGRTQALSTFAQPFMGMSFDAPATGFSMGGFTVPFTGSPNTMSPGGVPIPGTKPTRINF